VKEYGEMTIHLGLTAAPAVLGLFIGLAHRARPRLGALARELSDLITLRMVLRGSRPSQRSQLLAAHRGWRTDRAAEPRAGNRYRRTRPPWL
jgi:hypothetical protein